MSDNKLTINIKKNKNCKTLLTVEYMLLASYTN